jgi:hypothetical protein
LDAGLSMKTIEEWSVDPRISFPDGSQGSVFDAFEDMNCEEVLAKMVELNKLKAQNDDSELKNSAFVFVKPHANTPATQKLVRDGLAKAGITILSENDIAGKVIDEKKLIDQHYYAIGKLSYTVEWLSDVCNTHLTASPRHILYLQHPRRRFYPPKTSPCQRKSSKRHSESHGIRF